MRRPLAEELTVNFYEWERAGRGWYVFNTPVELEPVFEPFFFHESAIKVIDDSKAPSIFGSVGNLIEKALWPKAKAEEQEEVFSTEPEILAYPFVAREPLVGFSISMPDGEKLKPDEIEKFLVMLSYCKTQVSFEIIATHVFIRLQFVCAESDRLHIESQLKAYFPGCIIHDQSGTLNSVLKEDGYNYIVGFGLEEEFMRPLLMPEKFEVDPLTGLFGALENLRDDEQAVIQVLFKGTVNPWAKSIMSSVTDEKGGSFFMDAPEMPKLAMEKIRSPLYGASIRAVGSGETAERALAVLDRVSYAIMQSSRSGSNSLIPLTKNGYEYERFANDILLRQSHRTGMLLSAKELATFVRYPFAITSKKLERDMRKTKAAPKIAEGNEFILGRNVHQGVERIATLSGKSS